MKKIIKKINIGREIDTSKICPFINKNCIKDECVAFSKRMDINIVSIEEKIEAQNKGEIAPEEILLSQGWNKYAEVGLSETIFIRETTKPNSANCIALLSISSIRQSENDYEYQIQNQVEIKEEEAKSLPKTNVEILADIKEPIWLLYNDEKLLRINNMNFGILSINEYGRIQKGWSGIMDFGEHISCWGNDDNLRTISKKKINDLNIDNCYFFTKPEIRRIFEDGLDIYNNIPEQGLRRFKEKN